MAEPKMYTFNGETHTLRDWAEITGIPKKSLRSRLGKGWPLERALTEPLCHNPSARGRRGAKVTSWRNDINPN